MEFTYIAIFSIWTLINAPLSLRESHNFLYASIYVSHSSHSQTLPVRFFPDILAISSYDNKCGSSVVGLVECCFILNVTVPKSSYIIYIITYLCKILKIDWGHTYTSRVLVLVLVLVLLFILGYPLAMG